MNFNDPLFRPLRLLLFPFSLLYGFAVWVRNSLFNAGISKSASFDTPVICIGNLSAGGTGKSPMVEYLIRLLNDTKPTAVLSRGYKRKTSGYLLATSASTVNDIGDEPMQIHRKFPGTVVAVGEKRAEAIPKLLTERPDTGIIILDDAFQHRQVKAGLNILLTDFSHLYTRDWFLPTGNLRDEKKSAKRADVIIVTKCRSQLSVNEKRSIVGEIGPGTHQHIFFTDISYGQLYHIFTGETIPEHIAQSVLLVTGIANPVPLQNHVRQATASCDEMFFGDHHSFSDSDIDEITRRFNLIDSTDKIIITTEKDAVRLHAFKNKIHELPVYVIPIQSRFLFGEGKQFNDLIATFIKGFGTQTHHN